MASDSKGGSRPVPTPMDKFTDLMGAVPVKPKPKKAKSGKK